MVFIRRLMMMLIFGAEKGRNKDDFQLYHVEQRRSLNNGAMDFLVH
jgi:hypothetical protein